MHILIIPSEEYLPEEGGLQGVFQQHQAIALQQAGYRVGIISPILRSIRSLFDQWPAWGQRIKYEDDLHVIRYFGWYHPKSGKNRARSQWINCGVRLYEEYRKRFGSPDLIHAHNALNAGILASKIAEYNGIPYIITEHHSAYRRNLIHKDDIPSIARAYRFASAKVVVSPSLGNDLVRVIGEAGAGWEWIPNVLPPFFEIQSYSFIQELKSGFCFLNVASLDEKKGHKDLLYAYADSFRSRNNVKLRIVGDGPLKSHLMKLADELGISEQVFFTGIKNHEGVLREMLGCDAFVLASHFETFGVVLIEALACGKPVIATKCGGPEWFVEREDGILVQSKSPDSLSDAMSAMVNGKFHYDSQTIKERCINRFGSVTFARSMGDIYKRVLGL